MELADIVYSQRHNTQLEATRLAGTVDNKARQDRDSSVSVLSCASWRARITPSAINSPRRFGQPACRLHARRIDEAQLAFDHPPIHPFIRSNTSIALGILQYTPP